MKRKISLIKFVWLVLAILLISNSILAQNNNPWNIVQNKDNPYDEVGLKHNRNLDEFLQSAEFQAFKESKEKDYSAFMTDYFFGCCKKKESRFCCFELPGPLGDRKPEDIIKIIKEEKDPLKILSKLETSKSVKSYAKSIISILKSLPENKSLSRVDYKDLFALEKKVISDRKISKDEKKKVLMMASTARFSSLYWNREKLEARNPKLPILQAKQIKIDWDEVAGVDTICAVAGPEAAAVGSVADIFLQIARQ